MHLSLQLVLFWKNERKVKVVGVTFHILVAGGAQVPMSLLSLYRLPLCNSYFPGWYNGHRSASSDTIPEACRQVQLHSVLASYHRSQKSLYYNLFFCIMECEDTRSVS